MKNEPFQGPTFRWLPAAHQGGRGRGSVSKKRWAEESPYASLSDELKTQIYSK